MFYTNRKHWTTAEENFVAENADKMTTAEIARKINRTEVAVQQYMHRKRINPYEKVVRNLVREILTKKFTNPEYFNPNRSFYDSVVAWARPLSNPMRLRMYTITIKDNGMPEVWEPL